MRAVFDLCDLCVCAQLGQPLFHREEITLHLSTSSGDVAKPGEKNQNSNQKVKAGKDAFYGGDFLLCCWFVVFLWLFPPLFLVVVAGILLFCFVFLSGFRCSFCNHFPLGQSSARCSPSLSPSCRAQTLLCKRHLLPNHLLRSKIQSLQRCSFLRPSLFKLLSPAPLLEETGCGIWGMLFHGVAVWCEEEAAGISVGEPKSQYFS